jgi:UDP-N-acetylmuramate dehydrogenase
MEILKDISLAPYTTFKIGGNATYFAHVTNLKDLSETLVFAKEHNFLGADNLLCLGGGSNMLISDKGFNGLVLSLENKGIEIVEEDVDSVLINIASGEVWDDVVAWSVENGFWGIENMSAIPGNVGAFAVQNVGAYGQEASQVLDSVRVVDIQSGESKIISSEHCGLSYRKSIFNSGQKGKYLIFSIVIKLSKIPNPNLTYKDLKNYFAENTNPTLQEIRQAVIAIRSAKLPNPKEMGNAGSFFKNIFVNQVELQEIGNKVSAKFGLPAQQKLLAISKSQGDDKIKIPSAYLIEVCDLKGYAMGPAKIYEKHALVLVNTGGAKATDILNLVKHIRETVYQNTGAVLDCEPNFVGFTPDELGELMHIST